METLAKIAVVLIVLAAVWYAVSDKYDGKRKRRRTLAPAHDERNWQRAFMRDCKRGYPRH